MVESNHGSSAARPSDFELTTDPWGRLLHALAVGNPRSVAMTKMVRACVVLALVTSVASAVSFAESGEAVYKANCQSCHGSTGTPNPGMAKMMGIKASSEYKTSEKEQFDAVKDGKGKMKPFASKLTDAQIKDAVSFFRTLK
jgi:mono/diheme cytochrome c family protein